MANRLLHKVKRNGRLKEFMQNMGFTEEKVKYVLNRFLNAEIKQDSIEPEHVLRASEASARILGMNRDKLQVVTADLTSLLTAIEKEKLSSIEGEKQNTIPLLNNKNDIIDKSL